MKNISTIKERILQLIEYKNITKNKFYIATGVSNGVLDKKGGLTLDTVEKIYSTYPDININWLLFEEGKMINSAEYKSNETEIIINEPITQYHNHNDLAAYIMDHEEELLKNKRFSAWYKTVFQMGRIAELRDFIESGTKKAATAASHKG